MSVLSLPSSASCYSLIQNQIRAVQSNQRLVAIKVTHFVPISQILIACGFERTQEGEEIFFTLPEAKVASITGKP